MNLLKAALSVSAMTLLSRITGLAREVLMASTFGAGAATDAFFVAFRIPNMLRRLFAEGAFTQGFVPVLADYKARLGEDAVQELINRVATLLGVVVALVTAIGVVAAPAIVYALTLGYGGDKAKLDLTTSLLRWLFPYIFCISLVSLAGGVLNTYSRFKGPAFTPVLLNLSMIAAMVFVAPRLAEDQRIYALAWGASAGGLLQLLFQVPQLMSLGKLPRFDWRPKDGGVLRILTLMGPAVIGVSVAQISLVINTQWAAGMGDKAVSWLSYADRLMEFPTALLGVALGAVILPSLAKHKSVENHDEFSKLVDWGLRLCLLLALPAAVGLVVLAVPLTATLFWHGAFQQDDVMATRLAIWGYAVGLLGIISIKVLAPGFYAQQNVKTPMKVAVVTLFLTQIANVLLLSWVKSRPGWQPYSHAVLAFTISLGALFNAGVLLLLLKRAGVYRPGADWAAFALKVIVAAYAMGGVLWFAIGGSAGLSQDSRIFMMGHAMKRAIELSWLVGLGVAVYFGLLWAMGVRVRHFLLRGAA